MATWGGLRKMLWFKLVNVEIGQAYLLEQPKVKLFGKSFTMNQSSKFIGDIFLDKFYNQTQSLTLRVIGLLILIQIVHRLS